jgi:hypothetical protein
MLVTQPILAVQIKDLQAPKSKRKRVLLAAQAAINF